MLLMLLRAAATALALFCTVAFHFQKTRSLRPQGAVLLYVSRPSSADLGIRMVPILVQIGSCGTSAEEARGQQACHCSRASRLHSDASRPPRDRPASENVSSPGICRSPF